MERQQLVYRVGVAVALTALIGAGGGSSHSSSTPRGSVSSAARSRTLKLAWVATDQPPDPGVWYGAQPELETALYEGLLQYKPSTSHIEPDLATSYTLSANRKTYTFHLRSGVKFSDGTPFNSAAVKFSWEREIKIDAAPSYMLANVASMSAASPSTFVVTLKEPTAAFVDYLCSPYGPDILSPTAITKHAGSNEGQTWLETHSAGTGPYTLVSYTGQGIVLKASPGYWGPKPYYKTVDISIVPNVSTEVLELEQGQIDALMSAVPISDLKSLEATGKLTVHEYPVIWKTLVFVNPSKGPFANLALRKALRYAIDPQAITLSARGSTGKPSVQFTPVDELPAGTAVDTWRYDPSRVAKLVSRVSDKNVTIAWTEGLTPDQLAAEVIQTELQAVGFHATVASETPDQLSNGAKDPSARPDLIVASVNPDTANPDSYFRIYMRTGGPLNAMGVSVPQADSLMDLASTLPRGSAQQTADYAKVAQLYINSGDFIPIVDPEATVVIQKYITHIAHSVLDPNGVILASLRPSS